MAQDREKLVRDHVEYARALANQLGRQLPSRPEMEELTAFALSGLAEAASRYDPDKGAAFRTFAYYRIRGAMFDGLRRSGWLARGDHARVKAQQHADDLLEAAAAVPGSTARDAVQAARELRDLLGDVTAVFVTAVDGFENVADAPGATRPARAMNRRSWNT